MQKQRAQILPKFSSCLVPPVDSITGFYSSRKRSAAEFTISSQKVGKRVTGFVHKWGNGTQEAQKRTQKAQVKHGTALFVLLVFSFVPFVFCSRFCWAKPVPQFG